jgi:putative mRNA 3-end processing factor
VTYGDRFDCASLVTAAKKVHYLPAVSRDELFVGDEAGLFCPAAGVYIDPWRPTRATPAVITHAHADHARAGAGRYIAAREGAELLRLRLGSDIDLTTYDYGETFVLNPNAPQPVEATFFPAGHVLGSAQIRLKSPNYPTTVVTGDFKRDHDPSCRAFQPVRCDTLIMEATFGLPVYRWPAVSTVVGDILRWKREIGDRPLVLFTYALGKAQRLMMEIARHPDWRRPTPILCHGAVATVHRAYERSGVALPPWEPVGQRRGAELRGALILAPPSAHRSPWMKRMKDPATAFVSGWMAVRGNRRRRGYERGFVLSDHADWDGLVATVRESGASRVFTTHGQNDVFARYLREEDGIRADPLSALAEGGEQRRDDAP